MRSVILIISARIFESLLWEGSLAVRVRKFGLPHSTQRINSPLQTEKGSSNFESHLEQ